MQAEITLDNDDNKRTEMNKDRGEGAQGKKAGVTGRGHQMLKH